MPNAKSPQKTTPKKQAATKAKLQSRLPHKHVLLALGWYSHEIHRGVARYARHAGWSLNIESLRFGHPPPNWKGDGVIAILGSDPEMDRFVTRLKLPTVNIGPKVIGGFPLVMPDNHAIGRMGAEHFLTRGFEHHVFYLRTGHAAEAQRMEGFRQRLEEDRRSLTLMDWQQAKSSGKLDLNDLHTWLIRELKTLPKPVGIMAEYDDHAIDIIDACLDADIPVPEQVAVLGVDNDTLSCELARVPLSSIDNNEESQGYHAAELLDHLMNGGTPPETPIILPPKLLVTRLSTDILAVEHPHVAAALRLVRDHYTEPVTAQMIAEQIPMCARRLHDAFVKEIGRTIAMEIAYKRIEHAKKLLVQTDSKTFEIAMLSGFSSELQMRKVFKRLLHTTPQTYRLTHRSRRS